ncbi:MAG: tRNA(Ile)-lysidine synthase [Verrucomicrobiota bacterium]|jgi:tRNA(Ile)-lysidine synthase
MPKAVRFRDTLLERFEPDLLALPRSTPAVVALSGGLDSCCLITLLLHAGFSQLTACHLDHALRPCSASDAEFVRAFCSKLAVPLFSQRVAVADIARSQHVSLETAGRTARHALYAESAARTGAAHVFLAHHADDQAETLLARLLRGSGTRGLAGMRAIQPLRTPKTQNPTQPPPAPLLLCRPMLQIWRRELESFAEQEHLAFCQDPSNTDPTPTRNRIRLQLIPELERLFGPSVRRNLLNTTQILRAEDDWLEAATPETGPELSVRMLRPLPLALQRRTLHRWLTGNVPGEIGFETVESVRALLHSRQAKANLPGGHHARRTAGKLWIQKPADAPPLGPV